jgi:Cu-Zn family superoxide dismutase
MTRYAISAAALLALAGCTTVGELPAERLGSATLSLGNGVPAGTAQLFASGDQVTLAVALTGIPAGKHGLHLHTTGSCKAPDFASAGGHLNPTGKHHGSLAADGKHFGDLPNVTIGSGGSGSVTADLMGTRAQALEWIFDADGTAVVVHAGPDDYKTDPSGDSGARVACGVLKPA